MPRMVPGVGDRSSDETRGEVGDPVAVEKETNGAIVRGWKCRRRLHGEGRRPRSPSLRCANRSRNASREIPKTGTCQGSSREPRPGPANGAVDRVNYGSPHPPEGIRIGSGGSVRDRSHTELAVALNSEETLEARILCATATSTAINPTSR